MLELYCYIKSASFYYEQNYPDSTITLSSILNRESSYKLVRTFIVGRLCTLNKYTETWEIDKHVK